MWKTLFTTIAILFTWTISNGQVGNNNDINNRPGNNNPEVNCYTYGDTVVVEGQQGIVLVDTCGVDEHHRDTILLDVVAEYYRLTSFSADSLSGKLVIKQVNQEGVVTSTEVQDAGLLPVFRSSDEAVADPDLEVGGFWQASYDNTMGVKPGTIFVKN